MITSLNYKTLMIVSSLFVFLVGCTPRVEVVAPSEPITINLNVKIEHEILVKIDKQLDDLFSDSSGLF